MSNIQKWGTYDSSAAKAEAEELAKSGTSAFVKPRSGENRYRFLPPLAGRNSPFVLVHQHFVKMPGMQNAASFNCPRVMAKRACPACAYAEKLRSTGNTADYEAAGDFMAKLRVYALILDRAAPELGPQVYAYGKQVHENLTTLRDSEDGGDFTDPIEGFDIVITKTGAQKETRYAVRPARQSSPLGDLSMIETMPDIQRYGRVLKDEEIYKMLGMSPPGSGGSMTQGVVVSSRKSNVSSKLTDVDDDV